MQQKTAAIMALPVAKFVPVFLFSALVLVALAMAALAAGTSEMNKVNYDMHTTSQFSVDGMPRSPTPPVLPLLQPILHPYPDTAFQASFGVPKKFSRYICACVPDEYYSKGGAASGLRPVRYEITFWGAMPIFGKVLPDQTVTISGVAGRPRVPGGTIKISMDTRLVFQNQICDCSW